jgi:hypothetical protein
MADSGPSPLVYALPALALALVAIWYAYGALDRMGLDVQRAQARVTAKQVAAGSTTYHTNTVGGRAWSQSSKNPEMYVIALDVNGEAAGGAVTPELYEALRPGDAVRVEFSRTRFSRRLVVTDVRR